jgi:hypothetical protein
MWYRKNRPVQPTIENCWELAPDNFIAGEIEHPLDDEA